MVVFSDGEYNIVGYGGGGNLGALTDEELIEQATDYLDRNAFDCDTYIVTVSVPRPEWQQVVKGTAKKVEKT